MTDGFERTEADKAFEQKLGEFLYNNTDDLEVADSEDCPHCGNYAGGDYNLEFGIVFDVRSNAAVSMQSGPFDAENWKILRRCAECHSYFIAENCNY